MNAQAEFQKLMMNEQDINSYLSSRDESDHINIKTPAQFLDELLAHFEGGDKPGLSLPWNKSRDDILFRPSELTIWNGINGHGKSNVLGMVILYAIREYKACIASLEMKPVTTLSRMARQAMGGNSPTSAFNRGMVQFMDGRLWLYDQQGTVSAEKLIGVMYYAAEKLGVEHFVVDSLMKCGIGEDDYNGQKRFVDRLCAVAKDTNMHVHLVTHAKKGNDEHEIPGKMSVKGSGSITDQADNVLTVWRNKKKEQMIAAGDTTFETKNIPDGFVICDKQRNGEWEGRIALWFDKSSMQYLENPNYHPRTMQEYLFAGEVIRN